MDRHQALALALARADSVAPGEVDSAPRAVDLVLLAVVLVVLVAEEKNSRVRCPALPLSPRVMEFQHPQHSLILHLFA